MILCFNCGTTCWFQQLESIYKDVRGMSECCQDMTSRLKVIPQKYTDLSSKVNAFRENYVLQTALSRDNTLFISELSLNSRIWS